jgi:adenosine deaminase
VQCWFALTTPSVHQGEEGDPETIRDAVEHLHARRIGHGIQAAKSESVMSFLRERGIPLEVSVTSNYIVGVVPSIAEHPITTLRDNGLLVTINTDDPVLFGDCTLSSEYHLLETQHHWTREDFKNANRIAFNASFIPESRRALFWSEELFDASK